MRVLDVSINERSKSDRMTIKLHFNNSEAAHKFKEMIWKFNDRVLNELPGPEGADLITFCDAVAAMLQMTGEPNEDSMKAPDPDFSLLRKVKRR